MIWLTALIIWILLTWGLAYAMSRAELLELPRVWLVMMAGRRIGAFLSWLLGCFICCSFWTGQAAACAVMANLPVPWHAWIYGPPAAGFCAVGWVDMLAFIRRAHMDKPKPPPPPEPEPVCPTCPADGGNPNA